MKIGIVGIGCIGSSLARDIIAQRLGDVAIYDANANYLSQAKALQLGEIYDDSAAFARACDIIFVCTPVRSISTVILECAPHMKAGSIITDVGSVKSFILAEIKGKMPVGVHYVPAHPVTFGTIGTGPDSGDVGNFVGRKYILTPDDTTDAEALHTLENMLVKIGAEIVKMSPMAHDLILGFTSHLSHVIAFSAVNVADKLSADEGVNVIDYAGGSFKDMTRVAESDMNMWRDIFLCNADYVHDVLQRMIEELKDFDGMMCRKDVTAIEDFITRANTIRRNSFK